MTKPLVLVLANKNVKIHTLWKFIISRGTTPTGMTKEELRHAFPTLVENEPQ